MKRLTTLAAAMFALLLFARPALAELKVGDDAPDFTLQASDGKTYKLSDFKGKQAVVVAWFPRAFTGGCTAECKSIKEHGNDIRKFEVAYFTASTDKVDGDKGNKAFAESMSADYPILSDPTGDTAKAYGILSDRGNAANRVTIYVGKDGKILEIDRKINTREAGKDLILKLKSLGVKEKS